MLSSPIPEAESQDQSTPSTKRDSKSTDGLRRSALSNVFDLSMSSVSSQTPSSTPIHGDDSVESYGEPLTEPSVARKNAILDPFAAGDVDSYLPQTVRGSSAPPETITNASQNPLASLSRPRPLSDQGGFCCPLAMSGGQARAAGESMCIPHPLFHYIVTSVFRHWWLNNGQCRDN